MNERSGVKASELLLLLTLGALLIGNLPAMLVVYAVADGLHLALKPTQLWAFSVGLTTVILITGRVVLRGWGLALLAQVAVAFTLSWLGAAPWRRTPTIMISVT